MELTVGCAGPMKNFQIAEGQRHHARPNSAGPALRIGAVRSNPRVFQGFFGGGKREPMGTRGEFQQLGIGSLTGAMKVFHFRPDLHRETAGIETFNFSSSAAACFETFPRAAHVVAHRRHHAQSCDSDSACHGFAWRVRFTRALPISLLPLRVSSESTGASAGLSATLISDSNS